MTERTVNTTSLNDVRGPRREILCTGLRPTRVRDGFVLCRSQYQTTQVLLCRSALVSPAASLSDSVKMLVAQMAQDAQPETENSFITCTSALSREDITNSGPAPPALGQEFTCFRLSPLREANTQILKSSKTYTLML